VTDSTHLQDNPSDWDARIDADVSAALDDMRTIAVIGLSPRPERDSHRVSAYMQRHGLRVIPVNPAAAGTNILGEPVYASLEDIPHRFDTVNVFRRSHQTDEPIDEAIAARARGVRQVWLQLGIVNPDGLRRARAAGLRAVENRCLMVEHRRLAP
jgi:predicted CoA-binding protein